MFISVAEIPMLKRILASNHDELVELIVNEARLAIVFGEIRQGDHGVSELMLPGGLWITPIELVGIFLRINFFCQFEDLEHEYGGRLPPINDTTRVQLVLAVPTHHGPAYLCRFVTAVSLSTFGREAIKTIPEGAASTHACFHSGTFRSLKPGQKELDVIADLGGGTLDICVVNQTVDDIGVQGYGSYYGLGGLHFNDILASALAAEIDVKLKLLGFDYRDFDTYRKLDKAWPREDIIKVMYCLVGYDEAKAKASISQVILLLIIENSCLYFKLIVH